MRGGGTRQQQDREVVDRRDGDRLVERRRQYSGDSLELDDGSDLRDSNTNMVIQVHRDSEGEEDIAREEEKRMGEKGGGGERKEKRRKGGGKRAAEREREE